MDTCSSGSRKRKACFDAETDSGATSKGAGSAKGAAHSDFRLSASPKRLAMDSRGSDISCQSQLMCGEWLDNMSLDSVLAFSPSADMSSSGSPSSFLTVTTAGTSKPQLSDEGASQLCESPLEPDVCSSEDGCCCELTAEPPSCTCFGTRLYAFSEDSLVRSMAAMYGFSPLCTSVGTSYFARLAARDERLMATAKAHPDFAPLVEGVCVDPEPTAVPLAQQLRSLTNPKQWLMALHLCCNYLAAKNIDKVKYRNLLTLILSHAHGHELPSRMAASLEIELLEALRWRLGPFFHTVPRCAGGPPPSSAVAADLPVESSA